MMDEGMDGRLFEERVREVATAATALRAPAGTWERIAARAGAGEAVLLPLEPLRPRSTAGAARAVRIAALVLLAGSAAAAAILPASPVRQWLEEVFTASNVAEEAPATEPAEAAPSAPRLTAETTLVLEPVNGEIVIALEEPARAMRLRVRFAEAGEPEVRATGGAAAAQFRSAAGRLTVVHASDGDLVLTIPRTLARVRVEVDGKAYLTKEQGQIRVLAPVADTAGSEILLQIRD